MLGGGARVGVHAPLVPTRGGGWCSGQAEQPGTRRPREGMEAAAGAAADVIWSWAEQLIEEGSLTPGVGRPRVGS